MIVSIGIVTYKLDSQELGRTVSSLVDALELARVKHNVMARLVFVINDEEPQRIAGIEKFVAELQPQLSEGVQLSIIQGHGNIGYGGGHNKAIMSTDSDYYLVLNPDVSFKDNVIADCISYMEAHPNTAMTVPQGYDHTDQYAYLSKRPPSILVLIVRGLSLRWLNRVFRSQLSRYTYSETLPAISPMPVILASGCFMFCKTRILKSIRGFDERYFLYFEDFDLSMRMQDHGKIVELPDVRIRHYGGQSTRKNGKRIRYFARSAIRFFNTYGWRSHKKFSDPLPEVTFDDDTTESLLKSSRQLTNGTK